MHPNSQFYYRKSIGTCDVFLCVSRTLQSACRIVQIDIKAAFDRANHQRILFKLYSVGIGGSLKSILTQFLSNRSHNVMMDGSWSKLVNVVSGVPQGSVIRPLLFLLCASELFYILENIKLICYADDSALMAVVPCPGVRVTVAKSLKRDLVKVTEWCDLWEMKLNTSKNKSMIVSRSRTMHPQSSPIHPPLLDEIEYD